MIGPEALAVAYGLCSALAWGAGDFAGGFASRRGKALTVVLFSQLIGGMLLLILVSTAAGRMPPLQHLVYGGLAGSFGVLGLVGLYQGLAQGRMGLVAPLSAVITAVIPMMFAWVMEGYPGSLRMIGFGIAILAVWFLSSPGGSSTIEGGELRLSIMAGLGFGLFFIFMDQAINQSILWPLLAARGAAIAVMCLVLATTRQLAPPSRGQYTFIVLAGTMDTTGNAAFAMAAHLGRLDIAAILASLYPASTVLLAWMFLRERLGQRQWVGVVTAGVALVFIAI
jgi:drug/metabolite transporter (DMT)-like permease